MAYYEQFLNGYITLPSALFEHFSVIFPNAEDFLVWLYFYENGDVAPSEIAEKIEKTLADVNASIDRLRTAKVLRVDATRNPIFDAYEAFKQLDRLTEVDKSSKSEKVSGEIDEDSDNVLQQLIMAFEAEMGTISPIQIEEIRSWLTEDKFKPKLIRAALKEAALNRKVSLNYIRAILRNWRNDGIVTITDVEERRIDREAAQQSELKNSFYIPIDGPWNQEQ